MQARYILVSVGAVFAFLAIRRRCRDGAWDPQARARIWVAFILGVVGGCLALFSKDRQVGGLDFVRIRTG